MFEAGSKFGHFVIEDLLGTGGMGVVYRAVDTRLDRAVALKLIRDELASSDDYRRRLTDEARAAARIDSPHVVKIWEHGEIDSQLYLSLEMVDGPDLGLASQVLRFEQKVDLAKQLCTGVAAAHKVGLLHRDLKPENIKITQNCVLKIMDFGLAKRVAHSPKETALLLTTETATSDRQFAGTICYSAPEQLTGERLTFCSDVFAIGVILYEMFVGSRPFFDAHPGKVVFSILNEDPRSPVAVNSDLPLWLDQMILRALAKRPGDRFQRAEDLLQVLEHPPDYSSNGAEALIRPRQTVTVIDLRNMTGDHDWDYFSEGFTEEVIRELSRRTNLVVSAQPTSIYTRHIQDLIERCRSDYVVTGTLLKWQSRIRMTLNVYRSRGAELLSGESYEGELEELFTLLSTAAKDVASRLAQEPGATVVDVRDPLVLNVGAYDYYLKGRAYYHTSKPEDLGFAETMYRRALELDPRMALAHAGLSDLFTFQYMFYYDRRVEKIESACTEAMLALAIEPRLPEAHRSLGRYYQSVGNFADALQCFVRAIESNPKFALAHRSLAWLHELQGDHDESMKWAKKSLELAPLDLETLVLIGLLQMDTRKYTAALSTLQRAIELGPDYGRAYYQMANVYFKIGALDQALHNYLLADKYRGDTNAPTQAGYVYLIKQQPDLAREKFLASIEMRYLPFVAYYFLGYLEARFGSTQAANEYFQKSIQEGTQIEAQEPGNLHVRGFRALALAGLGRVEESRELLQEMGAQANIDGEILYCLARGYGLLKDAPQARKFCQLAIESHTGPTIAEISVDPHFSGMEIELVDLLDSHDAAITPSH